MPSNVNNIKDKRSLSGVVGSKREPTELDIHLRSLYENITMLSIKVNVLIKMLSNAEVIRIDEFREKAELEKNSIIIRDNLINSKANIFESSEKIAEAIVSIITVIKPDLEIISDITEVFLPEIINISEIFPRKGNEALNMVISVFNKYKSNSNQKN